MERSSPNIVIVGGAGGLGRGAVEEHLRRGWNVTATVLESDALTDPSSDRLSVRILDTTDWSAVAAMADGFEQPIDRLFVIAGDAGPDGPIGDVDPEAFARLMLLNTLAPLRLIDRWHGALAPDATVAVMSSSQASLALNDDGTKESYRISKVGLNMGLKSLSIRHADRLTYIAINPGWVKTKLGGEDANMTVDESMPQVVDTLDRHAREGGMHFLNYDGQMLAW